MWNPFVSQWKEAGIEPECPATWEIQTQVVREAAEANNAVFVSVFDVFNGPNHDEDPVAKGWIGDDRMHPNDRGRAAIADALAAVGFEASEPPRRGARRSAARSLPTRRIARVAYRTRRRAEPTQRFV